MSATNDGAEVETVSFAASIPVLPAGTVLTGPPPDLGWWSASASDSDYTLEGADLAIFGNDDGVTLQGANDLVSFNGSQNSRGTVVGSDGGIAVVQATVSVYGNDDVVWFDPSDDVLNLTAATSGDWSTLYASSGAANLFGASLSVFGGGVTLNAVSGDDAVSLYDTAGTSDTVNGSNMTVTLNGYAKATVDGQDDAIWFENGSGSTVTVNAPSGGRDTAYGAGTIDVAGGAVVSVGGGAAINFESAGQTAYVSYTQGVWDRVGGAGGTTYVYDAQVVAEGGNQTVAFVSGADDAATLTGTNGNWDSLETYFSSYGYDDTVTIDSAQANLFGDVGTVYLEGQGTAVSLYRGNQYGDMTLLGSQATVIASASGVFSLSGGANTLFIAPPANGYADATLEGTNGAWDTVYADDVSLTLNGAQASVIGGGNEIYMELAGAAVSLYGATNSTDYVSGEGAVTLSGASATLEGESFYLYFGQGANSVNLYDTGDDTVTLAGLFGQDTIAGFEVTDKLALSKSEFANFQAFQNALTERNDDLVLTLDANDSVLFPYLQTDSISAGQVKFV